MLLGPLLLGALLVGVGPVEDLLLDELAGREGLEWGAGEVEVGLGGDREELGLGFAELVKLLVEAFEVRVELCLQLLLGLSVVLALEEFLGAVTPSTEVILVENDQIPIGLVKPGVLGLDVAGLVPAQQVLKRPEVDQRPPFVGRGRIGSGCLGEVLPAVEVGV